MKNTARQYIFYPHTNVKTNKTLWYWHRIAGNKIVADSGQGYATKQGVLRAIHSDAGTMMYVIREATMHLDAVRLNRARQQRRQK